MNKKILALLLAACLIVSNSISVYAEEQEAESTEIDSCQELISEEDVIIEDSEDLGDSEEDIVIIDEESSEDFEIILDDTINTGSSEILTEDFPIYQENMGDEIAKITEVPNTEGVGTMIFGDLLYEVNEYLSLEYPGSFEINPVRGRFKGTQLNVINTGEMPIIITAQSCVSTSWNSPHVVSPYKFFDWTNLNSYETHSNIALGFLVRDSYGNVITEFWFTDEAEQTPQWLYTMQPGEGISIELIGKHGMCWATACTLSYKSLVGFEVIHTSTEDSADSVDSTDETLPDEETSDIEEPTEEQDPPAKEQDMPAEEEPTTEQDQPAEQDPPAEQEPPAEQDPPPTQDNSDSLIENEQGVQGSDEGVDNSYQEQLNSSEGTYPETENSMIQNENTINDSIIEHIKEEHDTTETSQEQLGDSSSASYENVEPTQAINEQLNSNSDSVDNMVES